VALKGKKIISSIFLRVFSYYIALLLLFAVVLGLTFMNLYSNSNIDHRGADLERVGTNAANAMRSYILDDNFDDALEYLGMFNEIESGELWMVSNPDSYRPMNQVLETVKLSTVNSQAEFSELLQSAFKGQKKISTFFSDIHGATTLSAGIPIFGKGNEVCGALIIIETMTDIDEIKSTGMKMIFTSIIIGLVVTIVISTLFASQITRPVMKMKEVTTAL
jgi:hypothetical protein